MAFLAGIAESSARAGARSRCCRRRRRTASMPARDVAIDGAVVYSCHSDSTAVGWLLRRRLPIVFVDQAPAPGIPSVNVDDRCGRAGGRPAPRRPRASQRRHRDHRVRRRVRRPRRPARAAAGEHRAGAAAGLVGGARRGGHHPDRRTPAAHRLAGDRLQRRADAARARPARRRRPVLLRRHRARRDRARSRTPGSRCPPTSRSSASTTTRSPRRSRPALTTVRQDSQAKGRAAASLLVTAIDQRRTAADDTTNGSGGRAGGHACPPPRAADRARGAGQHRTPTWVTACALRDRLIAHRSGTPSHLVGPTIQALDLVRAVSPHIRHHPRRRSACAGDPWSPASSPSSSRAPARRSWRHRPKRPEHPASTWSRRT